MSTEIGAGTENRTRTITLATWQATFTSYPLKNGGADRGRTCDLLDANQTLSQLSYGPLSLNSVSFSKSQTKLPTTTVVTAIIPSSK